MIPPDLEPRRGSRSARIRVMVVDDHPAIREAVEDMVSNQMDLDFCGSAFSTDTTFRIVQEQTPDVAVVDIQLRDAHGLDLVQNLRAQFPSLQVVVFSMYDENVYAERAIRAGALGYVMKSEPTQSVVEAIRSAAQGEVYLSRRMASRLLTRMAGGRGLAPSEDGGSRGVLLEELTDREMAVFQMLGQGCGVEEISEQLNLSRKTVETYRRRAKEKLGFDSVSELLQYAIQWSYVQGAGAHSVPA